MAAMQALETKTDEELATETKYKSAAQAILGARAAERYDAKAARAHFQKAIAAARPQERMQLRRMADASLAMAERRPDDLKEAMERLGQAPPSSRQLFVLRILALINPPPGARAAGAPARHRADRPAGHRLLAHRLRPRQAHRAAVRRHRHRDRRSRSALFLIACDPRRPHARRAGGARRQSRRKHAAAAEPMCGRYTVATGDLAGLRARFGLDERVELRRRFNVAPGDEVVAVTRRRRCAAALGIPARQRLHDHQRPRGVAR